MCNGQRSVHFFPNVLYEHEHKHVKAQGNKYFYKIYIIFCWAPLYLRGKNYALYKLKPKNVAVAI